tara:strand:- start:860 stop:3214 length:2355 start_codon:yes stop_codon:yes gene_type:complete
MYTVGGVEYNISADTSGLMEGRRDVDSFSKSSQRSFGKTERSVEKLDTKVSLLAASIRAGLSTTVMMGIAGGLAAVAVSIVAMGTASAAAARNVKILADIAGMSVDNFKAMGFAAQSMGFDIEMLGSTMQDVKDKIGDFTAGGAGAFQDYADAMKLTEDQVKATAAEFTRMSGRDVLIAMTTRMEDAGVSSSELIFALQAIGGETSRLAPLLRNNGKLLKESEQRFRELTHAIKLTNEERTDLLKLALAFDELAVHATGSMDKIAAESAPTLIKAMNKIVTYSTMAQNALGNLFADLKGEKRPETITNLANEIDTAQYKVESLIDTMLRLQKEPAGTMLMINPSSGEPLEDNDTNRIKYMAYLEKEVKKATISLENLQARFEQVRLEIEKRKLDPVAVESATNPFAGLAADQKEQIEKSMQQSLDYYSDLRDVTEKNLTIMHHLEEDFMGKEEASMIISKQKALKILSDRYESERDEFGRHSKSMSDLRSAQGEEVEHFEGKDATTSQIEKLKEQHEMQLEELRDFKSQEAEIEEAHKEAMLAVELEHDIKMKDFKKKQRELKLQAEIQGYAQLAGAMSGSFGNIADMLKKSEGEQSGAYKAMYAMQKGFAVAQAGLNFTLALSQAMALPTDVSLPQKLASYAAVATTFGGIMSSLSGASYGGGRQYGGPVSGGKQYEVNETGVPEILTTGGKDYLTMGASGGKVTPLDKAGMGMSVIVNNYGSPDLVETRMVDKQMVIDIARAEAGRARKGAVSDVAGQFADNKGTVYTNAVRNTTMRGVAGR